MEHNTPRINSAMMDKYLGRTVRLVCKLERYKGMDAIVTASDGGLVQVRMSENNRLESKYNEVIGTVERGFIKMHGHVVLFDDSELNDAGGKNNAGDDKDKLDMKLIDKVIQLSNGRFKHLFSLE